MDRISSFEVWTLSFPISLSEFDSVRTFVCIKCVVYKNYSFSYGLSQLKRGVIFNKNQWKIAFENMRNLTCSYSLYICLNSRWFSFFGFDKVWNIQTFSGFFEICSKNHHFWSILEVGSEIYEPIIRMLSNFGSYRS